MRSVNSVTLLGKDAMKQLLERIKRWWNGTPVPVPPKRTYSIAGWVRGEDGVYYNGGATIRREGRSWIRRNPDLQEGANGGIVLNGYTEESYFTLHAAIKQERPAAPEADAPLFPCPHGGNVGLCSQCNED
jgi:hypothetical protein